jgi:hypothetical protein
MVSNQLLGARVAAGLILLAGALAGCRHTPVTEGPGTEMAPASAPAPAATARAAEESTATEAALSGAAAPAPAPALTSAAINPTAPKSYVVKRGDTLWGIAATFLKDPWLWPEVWIINPQIPNPHLIYPGDTLALAYGANGQPYVTVSQAGSVRLDPRLRSTPFENAIPSIPFGAIAAFLSKPTVLTEEQIHKAPYIVGFRDMHQVAGSGNQIYVRNLTADENARYNVMHVSTELRDPDDGKLLGHMGIYTATALVQRPGNPAKALLIDPARETLAGDVLVSASQEAPANFTIKNPTAPVHARVIAIVDGTDLLGTYNVVAINRGQSAGIEPGMVLGVNAGADVVVDRYRNGKTLGEPNWGAGYSFLPRVDLPAERSGTLLVFKVFDRVSYALVVSSTDIMHTGDTVTNP